MKVKITRKFIVHGPIFAKKGDVVEVSAELGAQLVKAGSAEKIEETAAYGEKGGK